MGEVRSKLCEGCDGTGLVPMVHPTSPAGFADGRCPVCGGSGRRPVLDAARVAELRGLLEEWRGGAGVSLGGFVPHLGELLDGWEELRSLREAVQGLTGAQFDAEVLGLEGYGVPMPRAAWEAFLLAAAVDAALEMTALGACGKEVSGGGDDGE